MVNKLSGIEIREQIHDIGSNGPEALAKAIKSQTAQLLEGRKRGPAVLSEKERVLEQILKGRDVEVKMARLRTMMRYLLENGNYKQDAIQLRHLINSDLIQPGDDLIDFGAGPGDVVKNWHDMGNFAMGFDLSPTFVERSELLELSLIDDDMELLMPLIAKQRRRQKEAMRPLNKPTGNTVVTGSLIWDRLSQPGETAKNMIQLAEGKKSRFSFAVLLPNRPEDDEPNIPAHLRIKYTPEHKRIMRSGTVSEDLAAMQEYLQDTSKRLVTAEEAEYKVGTLSGDQKYNDYYILTSKV